MRILFPWSGKLSGILAALCIGSAVVAAPARFPVRFESPHTTYLNQSEKGRERVQQWQELFFAEFRQRPDVLEVEDKNKDSYYYRLSFQNDYPVGLVTIAIAPPDDPESYAARSWKTTELTDAILKEAAQTLPIPRCHRDFPLPDVPAGPRTLPEEAARKARQAADLWSGATPIVAANLAAVVPLLNDAIAAGIPDPAVEWCFYRIRTLSRSDFAALPPESQEMLRTLMRNYVAARMTALDSLAREAEAPWEDKAGWLRRIAARARRVCELRRLVRCEWDYRLAALSDADEQALARDFPAAQPALLEYFGSRWLLNRDRGNPERVFDGARVDFAWFLLTAPPGDYRNLAPEEQNALRDDLEWLAASPFYPTACAGIEGLYRLESAAGNADAAEQLYWRWNTLTRQCPAYPLYVKYEPPVAEIGRQVLTPERRMQLQCKLASGYGNYTLFLDNLENAAFPPEEAKTALDELDELLRLSPPGDPALRQRYEQLRQHIARGLQP